MSRRYEKRISSAGKYTQWVGFPTLNLYLPTAITWQTVPDRMIAVMSSSRGGLELHGGTRTEQMWMRGPYLDGKHVILDIAPPVGTAFYLHHTRHEQTFQALTLGNMGPEGIAQLSRGHNDRDLSPPSTPLADLTPIGQCVDGLDNDPDAFADSCDYNCVQHNDFGGDNWDYDVYAMSGALVTGREHQLGRYRRHPRARDRPYDGLGPRHRDVAQFHRWRVHEQRQQPNADPELGRRLGYL